MAYCYSAWGKISVYRHHSKSCELSNSKRVFPTLAQNERRGWRRLAAVVSCPTLGLHSTGTILSITAHGLPSASMSARRATAYFNTSEKTTTHVSSHVGRLNHVALFARNTYNSMKKGAFLDFTADHN